MVGWPRDSRICLQTKSKMNEIDAIFGLGISNENSKISSLEKSSQIEKINSLELKKKNKSQIDLQQSNQSTVLSKVSKKKKKKGLTTTTLAVTMAVPTTYTTTLTAVPTIAGISHDHDQNIMAGSAADSAAENIQVVELVEFNQEKLALKSGLTQKILQEQDDDGFFDCRGTGPRKKTEEGFNIYHEDELKIGLGGDTPECPFDCTCCY